MKHFPQKLPIDDVLSKVVTAFLNASNIVLSAPPGAGKTTRVPVALIDETWLEGKKIIMLEPRRLAARRAAEFMSAQLGEKVGQTVGYRIRGDAIVSTKTRIEVVTEGILTRMLQYSPDLPGTGLVIFDEFHERSIHADVGLALTLDVQNHLRDDLRILVMSATLDICTVSQLLSDAPIIKSEGKMYPVETIYSKFSSEKSPEQRMADAVARALQNNEGDILVFLPGRKEIRLVEHMLFEKHLPEGVVVHLLFGDAPYQQQSAALAEAPSGKRKVILSTSIAETSLTIDGVRVVIDSGSARTARFDPRRGMSGLVTVPVSKAVADQRRGRAGRQVAGTCYRLWTENEHEQLPDYPQPEIKVTDLAQLALDFARWGTPGGENLRFLDPPPPAHLAQARSLLKNLAAIDSDGRLTPHGRAMAELPVHPRLAHMLVRGKELGYGVLACEIAALLEERKAPSGNVDINLTELLHGFARKSKSEDNAAERINAQARRLQQMLDIKEKASLKDESVAGLLLALAYPERIARRRLQEGNRYLLAGGQTAVLPKGSLLAREEFLAIGEVDGLENEARIFLAAPIKRKQLEEIFAGDILIEEEIRWSENDKAVIARRVSKLGAIVLSEQQLDARGERVIAAMIEGIRTMGVQCLTWNKETRALQQRVQWLKNVSELPGDFPDLSDEVLLATLEKWLAPFLDGIKRADQLQKLSLEEILRAQFTYKQWQDLERLVPSHLKLPSGSRVALDYSGAKPVLAVRLQELFGQVDTPAILGGKVGVLIHLLSPARRPLAVTQDLHSFWTNVYPEICTQMRARYPKHVWPEDPLKAKPTSKTKRRQKR